jgi:hypothetical protein
VGGNRGDRTCGGSDMKLGEITERFVQCLCTTIREVELALNLLFTPSHLLKICWLRPVAADLSGVTPINTPSIHLRCKIESKSGIVLRLLRSRSDMPIRDLARKIFKSSKLQIQQNLCVITTDNKLLQGTRCVKNNNLQMFRYNCKVDWIGFQNCKRN